MARVKRATNAHKKRKVVLERASGYRGQRSRLYRKAKEQVLHSMTYAYRDRKDRKGNFRRLWIDPYYRIEDMAAHYMDEMRRVRAKDPTILEAFAWEELSRLRWLNNSAPPGMRWH